jgi:hypothetical protein
VLGHGKIAITTEHYISKVLVESLDYNLLFVLQFCEMGYNCLFTNKGVTVFRRNDGSFAFKGVLRGKLYLVDFIPKEVELDKCLIAKRNMGWLWYRRLAVNIVCHAINQLYLHHLLKKTSYELLTGNKSNVPYFWIFGSKCYVLHMRPKSSKFAPKVYEGFLLGYDSNSRAHHIFNKDSGCVETTCDAVFDETNGSQVEQYDLDDEEATCDALRTMTISDVRSQEINEDPSNEAAPPTQANDQD